MRERRSIWSMQPAPLFGLRGALGVGHPQMHCWCSLRGCGSEYYKQERNFILHLLELFPHVRILASFTETSAPCRRHSSLPRIPILPCYRRRYPRLRKVDAASLQRNESINKGPLYRLRSSKTYSSTLNQLLVAAPISCPKRQNHL